MAQGSAWMGKHDYEAAILSFRNATRLAPNDPEPLFQLGLAHLADNDALSARADFQRAVTLNARHWRAQLQLAELAARSAVPELDSARSRVEAVLAALPEDPDALRVLALVDIRRRALNDAASRLERALAKRPGFIAAATMLASIKLAHRDIPGAELVLNNVIRADHSSDDGVLALARLYLNTHRIAPAEKLFEQVLAKEPYNGPATLGLAAVRIQQRQPQRAEQLLSRVAPQSDTYQGIYESFLFANGKSAAALARMQSRQKARPGDRRLRDRLVRAYMAAGRFTDAEGLLNAGLKLDHRDASARLLRAELYVSRNRYAQAEADIRQLIGINAEAHWLAAEIHRARGDGDGERTELERCLEMDATFLPARIELARAANFSGDLATALRTLDQTPEFQRWSPLIVFERIWIEIQSRRLDTAEAAIKEAERRGYGGPELELQKAAVALLNRDVTIARDEAARALRRRPRDSQAIQILLGTYENPAERRAVLAKWLHDNGSARSAAAKQVSGVLLFRLGDYNAARTAFASALALDPADWSADLGMAAVQAASDRASSREHLKRVLELTGGHVGAYVMLGQMDELDGNFEGAEDNYRKALDISPRNVRALNNLAYLLLEHQGRFDEALHLAQRAHDLAPEDPAVNDTLGWSFFRLGIYQSADIYLKKAQGKDPSAIRLLHMSRLAEKLGDPARAASLLAAARRADPSVSIP